MKRSMFRTIFRLTGCVILGSLFMGCATQTPVAVIPDTTITPPAPTLTPNATPTATETIQAQSTATATSTPVAEATAEVTPESTVDMSNVINQYFEAVERNDIDMYVDVFDEDIELVVVNRTFRGHSGIEQFGQNEVLGGKYVVLGQKQVSETNVKILLEFTPSGWSTPEPKAVYDFTIVNDKIVKANLQYASQEDIDELSTVSAAESETDQNNVPAPFQCYLDGVAAQNLDATTACFADDALVIDVGRHIEGKEAIHRWLNNEVMGLVYEVESVTPKPGGVVMIVKITFGSGSSGFRAEYDINIENGLIVRMDLQYA